METESHEIDHSRKQIWVDRLILIFLTTALLLPSLKINFVSDNLEHIIQAREVLADTTSQYYRPLTVMTFILDQALWQLRPFGYHATNLLLHLVALLLVYELMRRLTKRRAPAFAGALLFALHPVHSMSIFWLSGRVDILCSVFVLLALILLILPNYSRGHRYLLFSILAFVAALGSKEMSLSAPLLALALTWTVPEAGGSFRRAIKRSWPFFAVAGGYLLVRFLTAGSAVFASNVHANIDPVHLAKNLAIYLGLLVVPGGHIEIATYLNANPVVFAVGAIVAVAATIFALRWMNRSRVALFFALFLLISLLPVMRLAARWYLYLPSVGFCALFGYLVTLPNTSGKYRFLVRTALAAVSIIYAVTLWQNQSRWINAGELAHKVSGEIVERLYEERVTNVYLLTVPAEIQQTPVLMHGLQDYIDWRARESALSIDSLKITPVTYLTLGSVNDMARCDVSAPDESTYVINAGGESYFEFPADADVVSGRVKLQVGDSLDNLDHTVMIERINRNGRVDQVSVRLKDPLRPVLFFEEGRAAIRRPLPRPPFRTE